MMYTCKFCKKTIKNKKDLIRHERVHTGEKPFPCPTCEKSFSLKDNLKKHLLVHSGEKTHQCDHCQKSFGLKGNLDTHIKNVHEGRKCGYLGCENSVRSNGMCTQHRVTAAPYVPPTQKQKEAKDQGVILRNEDNPLKTRFRALFTLRNINTPVAIEQIGLCFSDPSALLKHELAYCLGQMQSPEAIPVLSNVLGIFEEHPMVRHAAAEALGAIGGEECLAILEKYEDDKVVEVSETVGVALGRISHLQEASSSGEEEPLEQSNPYLSVDPAFPMKWCKDVEFLEKILMDGKLSLYLRYQAMFSLRNLSTHASIEALGMGLKSTSALLRHEIAFVLGQLEEPQSIQVLTENLKDLSENEMVRHECAKALGSIGTMECETILKEFLSDEKPMIKESCEIALQLLVPRFFYPEGNDQGWMKLFGFRLVNKITKVLSPPYVGFTTCIDPKIAAKKNKDNGHCSNTEAIPAGYEIDTSTAFFIELYSNFDQGIKDLKFFSRRHIIDCPVTLGSHKSNLTLDRFKEEIFKVLESTPQLQGHFTRDDVWQMNQKIQSWEEKKEDDMDIDPEWTVEELEGEIGKIDKEFGDFKMKYDAKRQKLMDAIVQKKYFLQI